MHVLEVARQNYVARQLLARRAVLATRKAWAQVDPQAIRATWHAHVGPAVERMLTGAQHDAAATADAFVTAALKTQEQPDSAAGTVNPTAFSGTASDGRDLATLLELSNVYALQQIKQGATPAQGLAIGGRWLAQTVGMQVLDAGRAATGVSITTRHHDVGYIRVTNGAACARCAILAGRWYRYNADFERHVSCQCGQVPAAEEDSQGLRADPMQMFREGQITGLSKADTQAIRDGADLNQVVNAHRGMYTASGRSFTREGVTKRGVFGAGVQRLTPEQIYREARSRSEAIDLLHQNGYLTDRAVVSKEVTAPIQISSPAPSDVAARLIERATEAEPRLTALTTDLAERHGGQMAGLDFRLKTEDSLARKIAADVKDTGSTAEEIGAKMFDVNRYTTVFPAASYAENAQAVLDALREDGYVLNVKNYWTKADNPYQGINVQVTSPDGVQWELQFHTPESLAVKEGELHTIYEQSRVTTDEELLRQYTAQSFAASAKIPVPPEVQSVR